MGTSISDEPRVQAANREDLATLLANYYRRGEAARLLGVSGEWVDRLGERGALPIVRSPFGKLFPRAAVEALAEKRRRAEVPA